MIIMIRKKRFLRAAGVLAAAVVLGAGIFTAAGVLQEKSLNTAADGNWGLSFQEAGEPPVANATMDYLKKRFKHSFNSKTTSISSLRTNFQGDKNVFLPLSSVSLASLTFSF